VGYSIVLGKDAPVPFPIAHQGHVHMFDIPGGIPNLDGLK